MIFRAQCILNFCNKLGLNFFSFSKAAGIIYNVSKFERPPLDQINYLIIRLVESRF